jgi:hypothetical protein
MGLSDRLEYVGHPAFLYNEQRNRCFTYNSNFNIQCSIVYILNDSAWRIISDKTTTKPSDIFKKPEYPFWTDDFSNLFQVLK